MIIFFLNFEKYFIMFHVSRHLEAPSSIPYLSQSLPWTKKSPSIFEISPVSEPFGHYNMMIIDLNYERGILTIVIFR